MESRWQLRFRLRRSSNWIRWSRSESVHDSPTAEWAPCSDCRRRRDLSTCDALWCVSNVIIIERTKKIEFVLYCATCFCEKNGDNNDNIKDSNFNSQRCCVQHLHDDNVSIDVNRLWARKAFVVQYLQHWWNQHYFQSVLFFKKKTKFERRLCLEPSWTHIPFFKKNTHD